MNKNFHFLLRITLLLLVVMVCTNLFSGPYTERRVKAGIKLFRTILAADIDISKKISTDGSLLLLLVYTDDKENADKLAELLKKSRTSGAKSTISNLPITVETTSEVSFQQYHERITAGIFITQPLLDEDLKSVIRYGIDRHIIIYSPYKGHVEDGVLSGLSVEASVRPYINIKTLQASNIRIKSFFMKVAKSYE